MAATLTALGCSEKDAAKCQEALDGTRKSVAASDPVLTSQWRERSYKYCEDQTALATLDKEITTKQSAEAAAKAAEAQRLAANAGLLLPRKPGKREEIYPAPLCSGQDGNQCVMVVIFGWGKDAGCGL